MLRSWPARRYVLLFLCVFLIASRIAVVLLPGDVHRYAQWATRIVLVALVAIYLALYRRDSNAGRIQFGMATILAIVTLAAIEAWGVSIGQGSLMTATLGTGLVLYWRVWVRRYEPLGGLSILVLLVLTMFLLAQISIWLSLAAKNIA